MQMPHDLQCHRDYREQSRATTDAIHSAWLQQDNILRTEYQRLADIAGARRHHADITQAAFSSITGHEYMWDRPNA
jgi:hypothetical protein